jgi:prepilin-type N-terminal cleavage/methylation domain-containing protein
VSRAFTIVELLVVIAIVAVLVGLAVTTMPGLMERAARADVLAKTRTMGQAVLKYVPDHAGKLPPLYHGQELE